MTKIKLGDKVIDKVTGFVGIAIAKAEYLNGCVQYGIKPKVDKDGKMVDVEYIDIDQLEVLLTRNEYGEMIVVPAEGKVTIVPPGGIMSDAPKK